LPSGQSLTLVSPSAASRRDAMPEFRRGPLAEWTTVSASLSDRSRGASSSTSSARVVERVEAALAERGLPPPAWV
jgi:hypothetical protein